MWHTLWGKNETTVCAFCSQFQFVEETVHSGNALGQNPMMDSLSLSVNCSVVNMPANILARFDAVWTPKCFCLGSGQGMQRSIYF